jgi:hypothetical protein
LHFGNGNEAARPVLLRQHEEARMSDLSPIPDLDEDLINGLDRFIADRVEDGAGHLSRNDAINAILREWLTAQHYVERQPDDPEDLEDPS